MEKGSSKTRLLLVLTPLEKEEGYVVGIDKNPATNQNVNVTVITDKDAKLVGGNDPWEQEKSMNYREKWTLQF
ncbi:hypothetical protein ACFSQ7_43930 [Paenibacillus rhizoplanae]